MTEPLSPMRVVVASMNPVKIRATYAGFHDMLPARAVSVEGVATSSPVPAQPHGDLETLRGAEIRAANAREISPEADAWVGIEGGVSDADGRMAAFAWVVVLSPRVVGRARTGTFTLPEPVARLVRGGLELGEADDRVFGRTNSKQGAGAVGLLTGGVIDREALYRHAVALALIPFANPALYRETEDDTPQRGRVGVKR